LDLWAQDKYESASSPLKIRLEGTASLPEAMGAASGSLVYGVVAMPAAPGDGVTASLAMPEEEAAGPVVSAIQRERHAMLEAYEAPTISTVSELARLVGKSRVQVSREIKEGLLLGMRLGSRGSRLPDWQLGSSGLVQTQKALMVEKTP
jgi:hypothetical protein